MTMISTLHRTAYLAIIAIVLSAAPEGEARSQTSQAILADLAINITCVSKPRSVLESNVVKFMEGEGFEVLNLGQIQHDHGVRILPTQIIGLDRDRRITEFVGLPGMDHKYAMTLSTPPPTRRDSGLERDILTFVKLTLDCRTRQVSRGENGPAVAKFYQSEVSRIEGLFRQADALQK